MDNKQYGVIVGGVVHHLTDDLEEAFTKAQELSKARPSYVVEFHEEFINGMAQY